MRRPTRFTMKLYLLWSLFRRIGLRRTTPSSPASSDAYTCSAHGAPPFRTVQPVTLRPVSYQGSVLTFDQGQITRYACLNLPRQAASSSAAGCQWPLLIYLHGSLAAQPALTLTSFRVRMQ